MVYLIGRPKVTSDFVPLMSPGRRLHGMPMVPFDQFPTPEDAPQGKGFPSGLGHRSNSLREDFFEKVEHALAVEKLIGPVVVKIRLAQIFQILGVVVVQLDDFPNERLVAGKVGPVQEAARVELFIDGWIAPVNWQASRHHRLENFLRGIPARERFSKAMLNLYWRRKLDFFACSAGDGAADVVKDSPAAIHSFVSEQLAEKFHAIAILAPIIAAIMKLQNFFLAARISPGRRFA